MQKQGPVFVYDSGIGGVSVLIELVKRLPHEDFIYFGDCANAPYGTRSREEVLGFSRKALLRARESGAKAMVIACNTATAAAATVLRSENPDFPVIGIEPAIKPAALCMEHPRVLIMATPMTLSLEKFRTLEESLSDAAEFEALPCAGLVELIEQGLYDAPQTEEFLKELLKEELRDPPNAVVLGCTHYPFIKKTLQKLFGGNMLFFDGAEGTARQLERVLDARGALSVRKRRGRVFFTVSGGREESVALMKKLFENGVKRAGEKPGEGAEL